MPSMKFRNNNNKETKLNVTGEEILKKMNQIKIYQVLKIELDGDLDKSTETIRKLNFPKEHQFEEEMFDLSSLVWYWRLSMMGFVEFEQEMGFGSSFFQYFC